METSNSLLSTTDCETILENCLKPNHLKVTSYTVKSLSDKIEGFLGEHFFVTIEYEDKEGTPKSQRCFMKVLNGSSKLIFEISKCLKAYNKEEFFYNFLLNEFDKYDIDTSFSPRGYFCKPYLLVLEDLSQKNFVGFPDKSRFLDMDHCKVGLRTLAKLHASGLLYETVKSTEQESPYSLLDDFPDMFQDTLFAKGEDNLVQRWLELSIQAVFALIPIICENTNINKEDFTTKLKLGLQNAENFTEYLTKFKGTILHGDVWFNNFMFKYNGETVTESVVFDYQLLKYGPPSIDVLHFLYTNTRKYFRDSHYDELLEFYYNELTTFLPEYDLHLHIPKDQFVQLCNDAQPVLKLQCICDRSVTLLADDIEERAPNDEVLEINLFYRRTERILNSFNNNPFFREVISEDMIELYNILNKC